MYSSVYFQENHLVEVLICGFDTKLKDFRECHIEPDWLLMYQIFHNELILSATATGTHSDLFDK